MLDRLRTDFRLSIITLMGASAVLGITPFAVFRFFTGDLRSGIVDSAILAGIIVLVTYAWMSDRTDRAGCLLAIFLCTGATLVALMQADTRIFWLFPTFVTSFFLTTPTMAVVINATAITILITGEAGFSSPQQMWSFVATSLMVSACSFVFARRTESQRVQLKRLATFDPLTGARNRRVMDEALQEATANAARTGVSYALVMLDLDHFKHINDTYGHTAGDKVLIQLVQLIQDNSREVDLLFRFGGEEFVILLTGADQQGARIAIRGLREILARDLKGPNGRVTASFGVAVLHKGETAESWLARADAALYRAKEAGRDCFIIDDPNSRSPS